jgi:hypothetical protein
MCLLCLQDMGPPGLDQMDDSLTQQQPLQPLMSLKVAPPAGVSEPSNENESVKLPQALEQVLAFKSERARQLGNEDEQIQGRCTDTGVSYCPNGGKQLYQVREF